MAAGDGGVGPAADVGHLVPASSLDDLLPHPGQRRQVLHGLPELSWEVVSEVLPAPGGAWDSARHVYLQLSAALRA